MENYLEVAKSITDGAAEIALKYFGFETETTWKNDNTPLTIADTEINTYVISRIHSAFPEHSVLGEEESNKKEKSEFVWVCDPIDGTAPFSCGLPFFTFSLALVNQKTGLPILGIVNDPVLKNMYWANKNSGAYRNGIKISVSQNGNIKNSFMNIDASARGLDINYSNTNTLGALQEKEVKIMKLLSIIYGGIQVANGKFSGSIFFGPYAHDIAALKIIVEEAGGKVTDLLGDERRYDENGLGAVISNGIVHKQILDCIR